MTDPADLRQTYDRDGLTERGVEADPLDVFTRWFEDATGAVHEPNAMTLATVGADGQPAARIVLLKAFGAEGFAFYTNYESRKGRDLAAHPRAALVFWWEPLERQVRIEGTVERVSEHESDEYFARRPRGSRLGAWASDQSRPVPDREALEDRLAEVTARFDGEAVSRPPYWGGFRLAPTRFEFWQGRPDRLHDRLEYAPDGGDGWVIRRLAP